MRGKNEGWLQRFRSSVTLYWVPLLVVAFGLFVFLFAVLKGICFFPSRVSDVAALGAGLVSGGLVALAIAWTENRVSERQENLLRRFQLGLQADLTGVDLDNLDVEGLHLAGKSLAHASAANCVLTRVNLRSADCSEGDFSGARIVRSTLTGCKFRSAVLVGCVIEESEADAIFDEAVMRSCKIVDSSLRDASFLGTDATGSIFVNTGITDEQIATFLVPPREWS
jgi:uncharacterized protein YjbI with pentapeptide repeats